MAEISEKSVDEKQDSGSRAVLQRELVALVEKICAGNQAAFQAFYDKTSAVCYGMALKMLGDEARAKDLLQEVYLDVWSDAARFDPQRGSVQAWLYTKIRYKALDTLRTEGRRGELQQEFVASAQSDAVAERAADSGNISEALLECIEQLAGSQRQSIVEAFVFGWTYSELAERIAVPLATVKSRVRRALVRLRECLQE